jgi:hypothetical protein
MATYRMDDGTIVSTQKATQSWGEEKDFDGRNHIGRSSGSQWHDQTLYRSSKGRYYLERCSRVQGEHNTAEYLTPEEAASWLLHNEHEIPEDLRQAAEQVGE